VAAPAARARPAARRAAARCPVCARWPRPESTAQQAAVRSTSKRSTRKRKTQRCCCTARLCSSRPVSGNLLLRHVAPAHANLLRAAAVHVRQAANALGLRCKRALQRKSRALRNEPSGLLEAAITCARARGGVSTAAARMYAHATALHAPFRRQQRFRSGSRLAPAAAPRPAVTARRCSVAACQRARAEDAGVVTKSVRVCARIVGVRVYSGVRREGSVRACVRAGSFGHTARASQHKLE
jgi:hypothetical protein